MPDVDMPHFQKPATCRVYTQGKRLCYAGCMDSVALHAHAVEAWLFGLDGSFHIATGKSAGQSCRSAVVPVGLLHRLDVGHGRLAVVYLDPVTDLPGLAGHALQPMVPHPAEAAFLDVLQRMMCGVAPAAEFWALLEDSLAPRRDIDARLYTALGLIEQRLEHNLSVENLAESVNLSPSRLIHLSQQELGLSLRRYRLLERMRRSALEIHAGKNLTATALELGFATPSHFSSSFRNMFGLTPSAALLGRGGPSLPRE